MLSKDEIDFSEIIEEYDLSQHIDELDQIGLTVVPPSTLRLDDSWFEQLRDAILRVGEARTGIKFDLENGPSGPIPGRPSEVGHIILQHMIYEDQVFEKVLTHPVKKVLMMHMLGQDHRLAVSDAWIKWQTPDSWNQEETTGFHVDQGMVPPPWNPEKPHIANMNWCLTNYAREDGALAYVPESHHEKRHPELGEALPRAVPVEASAGSLVMFQGGLWHGSYRKTTPGLRVTMLGQHCREYMLPFQDFKGRLPPEVFKRSGDPEYLRSLVRENETTLKVRPKDNSHVF
ncbi:MAG: phytanoyl-CoA dioxygenase family protein [Candidatus Azotimanducaceae bacterium]|uniref:Phytanoyl-CoA dioxygenase family protein n=1 Tax=OM182 bacterium TaxID=2510334 RepID=A0A520RYZ2_9GAMM|nr:hypothetical protein [Gammaproteobacteria bacterium]OUV67347.1 MAG: hypothetical protein CBC93_05770 [Gammaproteobacteria bacterium TMED133]RZO75428.1 MAG: hypothetical protein EVA68_07000 [OM182 bacterium]